MLARLRITPLIIFLIVMMGYSALPAHAQNENGVLIAISFPSDGATVNGIVQIRGSVIHPAFAFFHVEVAELPITDESQWRSLQPPVSQQVRDNVLAVWDTIDFPDGEYILRLRAEIVGEEELESITTEVHINVINATPTPPPPLPPTTTPTPLPGTPTPGPSPTSLIQQPPTRTPRPSVTPGGPTQTPEPFTLADSPLDPERLRRGALRGVVISLLAFLVFGFYLISRSAVRGGLRVLIWQVRKEVLNPLLNSLGRGKR